MLDIKIKLSTDFKVGDKLIFRAKSYDELQGYDKDSYSIVSITEVDTFCLWGKVIEGTLFSLGDEIMLNLKYWEKYSEESLISSALNLNMLHNTSHQLYELDKECDK